MPFLLAEILNFQCALHLKGVGSLSIVSNSLIYYKNTKEWEDLVKTAEIYFNNAEGQ